MCLLHFNLEKCSRLLTVIFCPSVVAILEAVCWHERSLRYWRLYEALWRKGDWCCNEKIALNSAFMTLSLCRLSFSRPWLNNIGRVGPSLLPCPHLHKDGFRLKCVTSVRLQLSNLHSGNVLMHRIIHLNRSWRKSQIPMRKFQRYPGVLLCHASVVYR